MQPVWSAPIALPVIQTRPGKAWGLEEQIGRAVNLLGQTSETEPTKVKVKPTGHSLMCQQVGST